MISMLICSERENELKYFASCSKELAETESDERWNFRFCRTEKELDQAAADGESYDIILVDVEVSGAVASVGL